jgi:hypothetical protein
MSAPDTTEELLVRVQALEAAIGQAPLALAFELQRQVRALRAEVDARMRQAAAPRRP